RWRRPIPGRRARRRDSRRDGVGPDNTSARLLDGPRPPLYSLAGMVLDPAETVMTLDGITLEARLQVPLSPHGGVVVCHPHPLYGGDMENPVVVRIAEACGALGLATLRFNFRGVGKSSGAHGVRGATPADAAANTGVAEELDVQAG